jgi:ribosomal protein S18 acetylase RimI-like enzyme
VSEPGFRPATAQDLDALVALMREFYAHEGIDFDPDVARAAMHGLLEDPSRGRAWLVVDAEGPAGYVALTLGWSLEYGGRDAFLDEIFLAERLRGRRLGERAIDLALEACRALGVRALHLEVARVNAPAQSLYRRLGFLDHDRYLMTKWLAGPKATG